MENLLQVDGKDPAEESLEMGLEVVGEVEHCLLLGLIEDLE